MNISPDPTKEDLTQPNLPEIEFPQTGSFEAMTAYQPVKFKEDSLLELFGDFEPTMDIDELLGEESMNTSMSSVTPKQNSPSSGKRIVTMSLRSKTTDASVNEHFDRSLLGKGITTHKKKSAAGTTSTVPSTGSVIAPASVPIMLHSDVSSAADNSPTVQIIANTDKLLIKKDWNEKPYECDVCHKRFVRTDHLKEHKDYSHLPEEKKRNLLKRKHR